MVQAAENLGFAPAVKGDLDDYVSADIDAIDFKVSRRDARAKFRSSGIDHRGCAGCSSDAGGGAGLLLLLVGLVVALRRRR